MNSTTAVATHGLVTALVLFLNDVVLVHNHVHLSSDDLGYLLLIVNTFAHSVHPYVLALANRLLPKAPGPVFITPPQVVPSNG